MYQCPSCESPVLEVVVTVFRAVIQDDDGNIQTDYARCSDEEWNDDSPMQCVACDYSGPALDFFKEDDE